MKVPSLDRLLKRFYLDPRSKNLCAYSTGYPVKRQVMVDGVRLHSGKIRHFIFEREWPSPATWSERMGVAKGGRRNRRSAAELGPRPEIGDITTDMDVIEEGGQWWTEIRGQDAEGRLAVQALGPWKNRTDAWKAGVYAQTGRTKT